MIVDFNGDTQRLADTTYDVAISGGGPAGITIALDLAAAGQRVALIEGGGLDYEDSSQAMYRGTSSGTPYPGIESSRLRYLGGTSNHWAGRCGWLDEIDFEPRINRILPGWPISRAEAYRFAPRARAILDLPRGPFRPAGPRPLASRHFRLTEFAMSKPTRFLAKYQGALRKHPRIDCYLHANLINIDADAAASRILSFTVGNYRGARRKLRARRYVVAHGAIENARALLNADDVMTAGLGNGSGLVGRCFMEHLDVRIGTFVATDAAFWAAGPVGLNPSVALMRKYHVNSGILALEPSVDPQFYGRTAPLRKWLSGPACRINAEWARRLLRGDCPGDGVISSMIEQVANPSSRVTLIAERDPLGLRRINLNWAIDRRDLRSIEILATELARDLARTNIARMQISPEIRSRSISAFGQQSHHMGTTRMSRDPRFGVVDPWQRVHGIDNLYMAGSSVFPTGGGINPTFTIIALSLRLADHLKTLA